jgi:hypothetical protein
MYAVRLMGHSWFQGQNAKGVACNKDLQKAMIFETLEKAETAAMFFTSTNPLWIGKVTVKRLKQVRIQSRIARVLEWKQVKNRKGETINVAAKTTISRVSVKRYVVK